MDSKVESTRFFSKTDTVIEFYTDLVYLTVLPSAVYIASNYRMTKSELEMLWRGKGNDLVSGNIPQIL